MPRATSNLSAKKQALTLTQLSSYDDILTDALVDRAYYWTTIPKNRPSYHPSRGVKEEEITKLIQNHIIVKPDLDLAEAKLLATDGLRRFYNGLKTTKEKLDFKQHLRRYTQIYLPDCPFEVSSTNRYTVTTHEASIVARRLIRRNERIKYLAGIQVHITPEEEAALSVRKKDFSIVVSSRSRVASLFMGPARFANHDCGANAKLVITGHAGIDIVAVRNIPVGEEITVTYGENYFGEDNCECLCQTCEDNMANGWKQPAGFVPVKRSIEDVMTSQGYNTRGRQRYGRADSRSRTPSITPNVRPKVPKTKARQLRDDDRASTTESSMLDGPASMLKRKRDTESLATPPVTPAKKHRTTQYGITLPPPRNERGTSSGDESGGIVSSSESCGGEAALTDATTPEDTTDPSDMLHKTTMAPHTAPAVKLEHDMGSTAAAELQDVKPFSDHNFGPVSILETPRPPRRTNGISIRDILNTPSVSGTPNDKSAGDRFAAAFELHSPSVPAEMQDALGQDTNTLPDNPLDLEPAPIQTGRRGRGGFRKKTETGSPGRDASSASSRHNADELSEPSTAPPRRREPGDYELTPRLLSQPDMAWVRCMNCTTAFVQQNAYYTRSSCPRCERHSKLYGYIWPKTEPEGPWDKEERVLDHRTVHRFLALDDELMVRGRAPLKRAQTATPKGDEPGVNQRKGMRRGLLSDDHHERDSSRSGSDVRRSGRMRVASLKAEGRA